MGSAHAFVSGSRRLLSDLYSCGEQARLADSADWKDHYALHLRWDCLLTKTLVVPDTDLFDGRFFLETDPQSLTDYIGRGFMDPRLPIEVRGRASTLEDSLAQFLLKSGRETLVRFPFTALPQEDVRRALADAVARTPVSKLNEHLGRGEGVPRAIASLLRNCLKDEGLDPKVVDMFEQGWTNWLAAEQRGLIQFRRWDPSFDFERARKEATPIEPTKHLLTAEGRDTNARLCTLLDAQQPAAYVVELFSNASASAASPEARLDLRTLRQWYFDIRYTAFGHQHGAGVGLQEDGTATPVDPLRQQARALTEDEEHLPEWGKVVLVPEEIEVPFAQMDGRSFRAFLKANDAALARWWHETDETALQRTLDELLKSVGSSTTTAGSAERFPLTLLETVAGPATLVGVSGATGDPVTGLVSGSVVLALARYVRRGVGAVIDRRSRQAVARRIVKRVIARPAFRDP